MSDPSIREGQILTGSLFNEPMRVDCAGQHPGELGDRPGRAAVRALIDAMLLAVPR